MVNEFYASSFGANGFSTLFGEVFSPERFRRLYIIKGGPGTGKSTFMKRLGARAEREGMDVEYYRCSSDPESLDGVIIPCLRCAVIDGTAPHTTDPVYPAAADSILNFGAFIDVNRAAKERERIIGIGKRIAARYANVRALLGAAAKLNYGLPKPESVRPLTDKMQKYAKKHLASVGSDSAAPYAQNGISGVRYVSSSVPGGGKLYEGLKRNYACFAVAGHRGTPDRFIAAVADIAEREGKAVVRCPRPEGGGLEAALICGEGRCYIASDGGDGYAGRINADRFVSLPPADGYERLCNRICRRLRDASDAEYREIARLHGELEEIYGSCTDFVGLTGYTLAAEEVIFGGKE